jgi:hypothetical protein
MAEPSPTTATTGRLGCAIRTPIGADRPKPSPPMAALRNPSGCRAGRRAISSGREEGASSTSTVSGGRRSASAASTCPARSAWPSPGGSGAAGRSIGLGAAPAGSGSTRTSSAQRPAGAASTARSTGLRCASAGSSVTSATRVPGSTSGPGSYGYCRKTGAPTARTRSWPASASRSRRRPAGRCPANRGWSCGKPARAPNASCQTGQASRSASSTSAAHVSGSSAPAPTTSTGAPACPIKSASSAIAAGSAARAGTSRAGAAISCASPAGASQSSIGTITSAGPRAVRASCQARASAPGTSWGRAGWSTQTGYSPASPSRRPARNGSWARWRRSCWPISTTSGARFTRAVARADTALPSPAVVWTSTKAGSPLPIAYPLAIPTSAPSWSASTNRKSSGRPPRNVTSVEPGLANTVVRPRSRRTSKTASRTAGPELVI